ncbi:MAG: hypothetical protein JJU21_06600 [Salinarimonas sp.]|nr:hypothetical protein [Salinarimonas sp.]
MSGYPCDPNKDNSAINNWISYGTTIFGSIMAGVQNFFLTQVAGASSGIARGMINTVSLIKSLSSGALGGAAGQDNAANGVAASLIGGMITASIAFSVASFGFTIAPIVMAVGISVVTAFVTMGIENFLERHNINFYDPLQAISDMGAG